MKTPRFWQSKNFISTALLPASYLYGIGAWLDQSCTSPKRAPLPVISVGNLTAGGAGKTPMVLAFVSILTSLGYVPHILTRGYGGMGPTAHRVAQDDDWRIVGDEPLLLARAAPTWVGRDRLATAVAAKNAGATILVCDDALQHHALYKDISLLVIDGPYGFGNGRLLPSGPLREPISAAAHRIDAVVMIGTDTQACAATFTQPTFAAQLAPAATNLSASPYFAFAGIGRPEKFYDSLRSLGVTLADTQDFPDHYPYRQTDLDQLRARAQALGATLITTEKDALKLPASQRGAVTVLPVSLQLADPSGFTHWLQQQLPAS